MKKNLKWVVLSGVLFFYAFLYLATTRRQCDDICQKFDRVSNHLLTDSCVVWLGQTNTSQYLLIVREYPPCSSWKALADSACRYMNNEGLRNYTVVIVSHDARDTLLKQTCP
jgi:hypothetical protein